MPQAPQVPTTLSGTVSFTTRPDPRFYASISQDAAGNWSAVPIPLPDSTHTKFGVTYTQKGLTSITQQTVLDFANDYILSHANEAMQRAALFIIQQNTPGTALTNAQAMWNWITAVNAYAQTLITTIAGYTFNQIVTFVIPNTAWPAPPASLPLLIPPTTQVVKS